MEKSQLNILIEEALRTKIDRSLPTDSLISLSRLLLITYDFFANSYIFPEIAQHNGNRHLVVEKLEELYNECIGRIKEDDSPVITAALLPTMFAFVYRSLLSMNNQKYQECDDMAVRLLENVPENKDKKDWRAVHSEMRIIMELATQMSKEDRKKDNLYKRLESVIKMWAQTMNADGCWNGISDIEALSRLEVMNRNSYMTLDNRYNHRISRGYHYYRNVSGSDVQTLSLIVALAAEIDDGPMDRQTIVAIQKVAERQVPVHTGFNERWEWCTLLLDCIFNLSWEQSK